LGEHHSACPGQSLGARFVMFGYTVA
jgi:hypothetical protein